MEKTGSPLLARGDASIQAGHCSNFVFLGHLHTQSMKNIVVNITISVDVKSSKSEIVKFGCVNAS